MIKVPISNLKVSSFEALRLKINKTKTICTKGVRYNRICLNILLYRLHTNTDCQTKLKVIVRSENSTVRSVQKGYINKRIVHFRRQNAVRTQLVRKNETDVHLDDENCR